MRTLAHQPESRDKPFHCPTLAKTSLQSHCKLSNLTIRIALAVILAFASQKLCFPPLSSATLAVVARLQLTTYA
jgi:hypothetical protein